LELWSKSWFANGEMGIIGEIRVPPRTVW